DEVGGSSPLPPTINDLRLYLGPSRSAALLEVIVLVRGDDRPVLAIHAMPMREKYRRLCRRLTMAKKNYARTLAGEPITDELVRGRCPVMAYTRHLTGPEDAPGSPSGSAVRGILASVVL
ncbi:MAG: hypothetical protein ACRDOB_17530, partial [Streptosporangiaceae bacterium]